MNFSFQMNNEIMFNGSNSAWETFQNCCISISHKISR